MSFNPQGYPFTALPTNLRGKLQPNQLAVLWVIQSYASKEDQTCYPSLSSIAKFACISKRTAQCVVNQLVALGYLERFSDFCNSFHIPIISKDIIIQPTSSGISASRP